MQALANADVCERGSQRAVGVAGDVLAVKVVVDDALAVVHVRVADGGDLQHCIKAGVVEVRGDDVPNGRFESRSSAAEQGRNLRSPMNREQKQLLRKRRVQRRNGVSCFEAAAESENCPSQGALAIARLRHRNRHR